MVKTNRARLMLSIEKLAKIKTMAIRRGFWYKKLNKAERALVELTIKIVREIRSFFLNRVLISIIEKLEASLEGGLAVFMRKVGQPLARKTSLIAQSWGSISAVEWRSDLGFIRFMTVMYINEPSRSETKLYACNVRKSKWTLYQ